MRKRDGTRGRVRFPHVIGATVAMALLVPAVAWASHDFSDVPDSNPFHDEISWMADTNITTGFPDGTFHPGDPVTRQAMSAFMQRLYNLQTGLTGSTYAANPTDPTTDEVWADTFAAAVVSVPTGTTGRIIATATVEVGCNNGNNTIVVVIVIPAACHLRLLDNGVPIPNVDWIVQESVDAASDGDVKIDIETVTIQVRTAATSLTGGHTISLQAMFNDNDSSPADNDLAMSIGDTVITAEVLLNDVT